MYALKERIVNGVESLLFPQKWFNPQGQTVVLTIHQKKEKNTGCGESQLLLPHMKEIVLFS